MLLSADKNVLTKYFASLIFWYKTAVPFKNEYEVTYLLMHFRSGMLP